MIKGLPEKLKDLRLKYGYSQKQVADKLGVSPSIMSNYETGTRTPSTEILLAISYLYHCSVDYLLGKPSAKPEFVVDTEGLSEKQLQVLIAVIDAMKNK